MGKQFKRKHPAKHEERVVSRLDTVTAASHEDLILCEDVLEFYETEVEAYDSPDEPPACASPIHCPLARRRASKRWSALVTAPTSRIARIMRLVLGEASWAAFVAHANAHYRAAFLAAFNGPLLRCVGRVSGAPCPRDATVDLAAPDAANCLAHLHLDTCSSACATTRSTARRWCASGAARLASAAEMAIVRRHTACFLPCTHPGRSHPTLAHAPSAGHQLNMPHYRRLRDVAA